MNNNERFKDFVFTNMSPIGVLHLAQCLIDIVDVCQRAKYCEDLEDIYDVLDEYCPSWKGDKK